MAIIPTSLDHPSMLQRMRVLTKTDVGAEGNTDAENAGLVTDETPASEEWRVLQASDEMSAAMTQFMNRRLYEKKFSEFLEGYEFVLEEVPREKAEKILETLKNSKVGQQELMRFAQKLFPDESDLVVVLRELLRKKSIKREIRNKAQGLLESVERQAGQKYIKAGINSALKAKLFGQVITVNPKRLRASYRDFLLQDLRAVDAYIEWVSNYGYEKRAQVLEFIQSSLLADIHSLDPSCSSFEFGLFLNKLCQLQLLNAVEVLFIHNMMNNKIVKASQEGEDYWLLFLLSLLKKPSSISELLNDILKKISVRMGIKEQISLLSAVYQGCKNLPSAIFTDEESLPDVMDTIRAMMGERYNEMLFERGSQDNGAGTNKYA